jgi:surfeit locus 1 family protein
MARRRFRPRLVPTVSFLIVLPTLIGLGVWQLHRAAEKRQLQDLYDARTEGPPIAVGGRIQAAEALRYRRVKFRGTYEPKYTVLIDNRVHEGHAGYHVVTPVRIAGTETRILVNRGWVPVGGDRSRLPDTTPPTGMQTFVGVATVPLKHVFRLSAPPPLGNTWQPVWQHLQIDRYAKAVPFSIQPVVVLLDPASPAGGYVRHWNRLNAGIAMHEGYAFQWFSMALALAALYLFVNFRRVDIRGEDEDDSQNLEA